MNAHQRRIVRRKSRRLQLAVFEPQLRSIREQLTALEKRQRARERGAVGDAMAAYFSDRPAPTPEQRSKYINRKWDGTFAELAKHDIQGDL
jgi:hypothetical protein